MKYVSAEEVQARLTPEKCRVLMRELFVSIAEGGVSHKLRTAMPLEPNSGKLLGVMPGYLPYGNCVGAKVITVFHDNFKRGLPSHQGIVAVFDADTGAPLGIVDGMSVSAVRTAAVSAVATDALAVPDARTLALIGAGVQARTHLKALSAVRKFDRVRVWSKFPEEAAAFVEREAPSCGCGLAACPTVEETVSDADVICTVTASKTPVLEGRWVKRGAHVNAVGACRAADRELDSACVAGARFFCDSVLSVNNESGDFLFPLKEGLITEKHLLGELGDVLTGNVPGRVSADDVTIFEALGLAAEDLACAAWLLENS